MAEAELVRETRVATGFARIDIDGQADVTLRQGSSEGVTIEDCVAMARHVGAEIWKRFQIPVYLYEAAATSPEKASP